MTFNRLIKVGISLFLLFGMHSAVSQQSKFHALFLSKFSENVSWPNPVDENVIGVLGKSEVLSHLSDFSKLRSNMKVISISGSSDLNQCNILYVTSSQIEKLSEFAQVIRDNHILVVSETDQNVGSGSDIGFFLEQGKLRFLVSKSSLDSKDLVMGSNLLGRGKIQ